MINVAVTGVGGGVGQSIIKSLAGTDYNVIALDGEQLAAGLYATQQAYVIPYARATDYVERLLEICKQEQCALLFPGLDAELMILSEHRARFEAIGTKVVVSEQNVITISDDKMATFSFLKEAGLPVPHTVALESYAAGCLPFPLIVKQAVGGARSKNVYLLKSEDEMTQFLAAHRGNESYFVAQEYIDGDEYTCGTVNVGGDCKGVIVMRRILRDGDTYKCFVEDNPVIEAAVRKLVQLLQPFGACNVQLRLRAGIPYVFEINARCSGTTASRSLCGFNEPLMIADFLLKNIQPAYTIKKQTILRYWKELVVDNLEIEELARQGSIARSIYEGL